MALVGLVVFWWLAPDRGAEGYEGKVDSARNALLLLMVLFGNVHIGNCRSETKSALRLSPLRTPFLLGGATVAFLVHVAAMDLPPLRAVLRTEPVDLTTWAVLVVLALTVLAAMEVHKWTWSFRHRQASIARG